MTVTEIIKGLEKEIHHADYHDLDYEDNVPVALLKNAYNLIIYHQSNIEICAEVIKRQDKDIERFKSEIDKQYEQTVADIKVNLANGGVSCHWCVEQTKAEAIRDFAEEFDDVLVAMRDEYAHTGRPEYGLVCEVVHHKLLKTLKEMVGEQE